MTKKEIDREIDKLEKRKMMFAERYLDKIIVINKEIEQLRALKGEANNAKVNA